MGLPDGPVDVLLGRRQEDLGAEALEDEAPFVADARRHAQFDVIPFGRAYHGDGDAGVARGRLKDGPVLGELAPLLLPW